MPSPCWTVEFWLFPCGSSDTGYPVDWSLQSIGLIYFVIGGAAAIVLPHLDKNIGVNDLDTKPEPIAGLKKSNWIGRKNLRQEKVVWRQSRISLSCFNLGQLDSRDSFNCTSYFIPFNLYPHDGHHHGQQPKKTLILQRWCINISMFHKWLNFEFYVCLLICGAYLCLNSPENYFHSYRQNYFHSYRPINHWCSGELQKLKFQKLVLGHNFWLECPKEISLGQTLTLPLLKK